MALILCIETATDICSVAIADNGHIISSMQDAVGNNHASRLHMLVAEALLKVDMPLHKLDAIAVSKGPGSYTGLRIGVSAAKGYCYAMQIPFIAINTLQSLANGYLIDNPNYKGLICPMIDARRMEVYCALYNNQLEEILPTQAKIIDENSFREELSTRSIVFIGNGAAKCKGVFESPNAVFETNYVCNSLYLSSIAQHAFEQKQFEDVAYFEPFYLKDFIGTVAKKRL